MTWIGSCSPLKHANLNCLGRYSFRPALPGRGTLRPLHEPADPADDEDTEAGT
ncbi:hypothetical protein [Streptomyces sp. NPDC088736]|uniref:hypothetical protein n=1 Tax=Streptomyces sp. NPDC088736 TaxID=3365881 RepID=UPI00380D6FD0